MSLASTSLIRAVSFVVEGVDLGVLGREPGVVRDESEIDCRTWLAEVLTSLTSPNLLSMSSNLALVVYSE